MQHPEVMESIESTSSLSLSLSLLFPSALSTTDGPLFPDMAKLTQAKTGVNLQAGDKPSLSMMYTLARDPELRSAAEKLMAALKGAGIEVDPKEAFKALQMMGDGFGGLGATNGLGGFHEGVNKGGKGEGEGEGEGEKK